MPNLKRPVWLVRLFSSQHPMLHPVFTGRASSRSCRTILGSAIALLCTSAIAPAATAQLPKPLDINGTPHVQMNGQSIPLTNVTRNLQPLPGTNTSPLSAIAAMQPRNATNNTPPFEMVGSNVSGLNSGIHLESSFADIQPQSLDFSAMGGDRSPLNNSGSTAPETFVRQITQNGWQANAVTDSNLIRVSAPGNLLSIDIDPQALENLGSQATLAELLTTPRGEPVAERLAQGQDTGSRVPTTVSNRVNGGIDSSLNPESTEILQHQKNYEAAISQVYRQNLGDRIPVIERSAVDIREMLTTIERQTGHRSAIVYAIAQPDALELIVMTADGEPLRQRVDGVTPQDLQRQVRRLRRTIKRPQQPEAFLAPAQTLYDWLIAPVHPHLEALGVDNLLFSLGSGLRTIPLGALHNGDFFFIEQYSFSQIPSVNLVDSDYQPAHESDVLAMGRSQFSADNALPAVPQELATVNEQFTQGKTFLNEGFTTKNLQRYSTQYDIVHLATHAYFDPQSPQDSYIQLWDAPLTFDDLRTINQGRYEPIELLILSACETGVDHEQAELGFGGLAIQAGAKSAIASLWPVSDVGTLALMQQLYAALANPNVTIKAEALRQAQLELLQTETPSQSTPNSELDLSHPYYWSAFTLIGSPW